MADSSSPKADRVAVVGAGLSGLAAARRIVDRAQALRRPVEVVVLEAKDRVGGAIWTDRRDGFTIEGGADSFITNKPWGVDLCRQIGLGDQLIGVDGQHRRSFVVRKGRLAPVPEGFVLMAPARIGPILATPILSWRGKLRMMMDLVLPRKADDSDESLSSFVKRRRARAAAGRRREIAAYHAPGTRHHFPHRPRGECRSGTGPLLFRQSRRPADRGGGPGDGAPETRRAKTEAGGRAGRPYRANGATRPARAVSAPPDP